MLLLLLAGQILAPDPPPRSMVRDHLIAECHRLLEHRRREVLSLATPAEVRARSRRLRERFVRAIGGLPARTPLNLRTVASIARDGYRIDKLVYESVPDHHVTAVLYVPEGEGPFPGVLVPCGHTANGKAGYQAVCALLAANGFVVLCYDPIGQGERVQLLDDRGRPLMKSTSEHTLVSIGAFLVGWSGTRYRVWDGIRSLDVLAGHPSVDPERLGCTGNSGGGLMTSLLMALDDRIGPAAPGCYVTSLEEKLVRIGPADGEQNIPGQLSFGMSHPDFLAMHAPAPALILCASRDFVPIDGTWESFREAKRIYGILGASGRVDLFEFDDTHAYSRPRREAAVRFMRRWLLGARDAPREPERDLLPAASLRCTDTGQVLTALGGRSVIDLAGERAGRLSEHRARPTAEAIRRRIGLGQVRAMEPRERGPGRYVFDVEPGIRIPVRVQGNADAVRQVLVATDRGKESVAAEEGSRVVAVDLRGMGESCPVGPEAPARARRGADQRAALYGIRLGRPYLGMRVLDLLTVADWMSRTSTSPIHLVGMGAAGPVALHAAALDRRISSVRIRESLVDWTTVVRAKTRRDPDGSVVWGALEDYDLPDLGTLIAPRPLHVERPRGPAGEAVPLESLRASWARCRRAYEARGAGARLRLSGR